MTDELNNTHDEGMDTVEDDISLTMVPDVDDAASFEAATLQAAEQMNNEPSASTEDESEETTDMWDGLLSE